MNKNTGIIIGIVLAVLLGGTYVSMGNKNEVMIKDVAEDKVMVESSNKPVMEKDAIKDGVMMSAGSYEAYAPEKIAKAETGNVVLFFRAGWCPSCRTVDSDIKANLSKIPENLTILDVNYDNSSDLKKKYSVTYQHTFVQVDKGGNLLKKWSGSPTLSALASEVK